MPIAVGRKLFCDQTTAPSLKDTVNIASKMHSNASRGPPSCCLRAYFVCFTRPSKSANHVFVSGWEFAEKCCFGQICLGYFFVWLHWLMWTSWMRQQKIMFWEFYFCLPTRGETESSNINSLVWFSCWLCAMRQDQYGASRPEETWTLTLSQWNLCSSFHTHPGGFLFCWYRITTDTVSQSQLFMHCACTCHHLSVFN